MAMRVTQRTMYNQFVNQMQTNLSAYMESNIQGSSQKKINRPSDDPAGMALVLNSRNIIADTVQMQRNLDTAKGWLNLQDQTLTQVSTTITAIKALAEQAATGSMSAANREQVSLQLREYFKQLVTLSNTEFEGKSIFAGHKYDSNAYETGLFVSTTDPDLQSTQWKVDGKSDKTLMVRFPTGGAVAAGTAYEWKTMNGEWQTGTVANNNGNLQMDINGVTVTVPNGTSVKAYNPDEAEGSDNGTMLYLRPAAYYQGDDNDPPPTVDVLGPMKNDITATDPQGTFKKNVLIRLDNTSNSADVQYSYSTDNGSTWVNASTTHDGAKMRLLVPGGYLDVEVPANKLVDGQQFVIRPHEADLGYEIMKDSYVSVNSVGKDIFGGLYKDASKNQNSPQPVFDGDARNLLEIVGELIGWCETNNQQGAQKCLDELTTAHDVVLTEAARVGGLEERLTLAKDVLSFQKLDQEERLSYVEDVDLTELLTRMAQQQLAYNTVLKSSSMIMQLNLTKFV